MRKTRVRGLAVQFEVIDAPVCRGARADDHRPGYSVLSVRLAIGGMIRMFKRSVWAGE